MKRSIIALATVSACTIPPETTAERTSELQVDGPQLLQAGAGVILFETTDDDHAIYQLGQQVFAVRAGTAPELIADVPAGNTAFVFPVRDVAFVWTNPDRTRPGFGVSPLYIWSAATGSHLASEASSIGTFATSANRDGDLVVFPASSPASGATGDLVLAATDLSWQTTLAAGVAMSFGSGPCAPRMVFRGDTDDVIGVTCTPGATTATFSTWHDGQRTDQPQPLSLPVRFWLDQRSEHAVSTLAGSRHPVEIDQHDRATVLAEVTALNVFFAGDGAVIYLTQIPGQRPSAWRVRAGHAPTHVADVNGIYARAFGSTGIALPITSPDGRRFPFFDAVNPAFGAPANVKVVDVRDDEPALTLDTSPANAIFGQPFTRDSDYTLYARFDTTSFAVGPMFGAGPRGNRQFSDDRGWAWDPASGSTITYNDNTDATFTYADLKSVDLSDETLTPHLIAAQANVTYFASHRGRGVVYTLDSGPAPGLYVAPID